MQNNTEGCGLEQLSEHGKAILNSAVGHFNQGTQSGNPVLYRLALKVLSNRPLTEDELMYVEHYPNVKRKFK